MLELCSQKMDTRLSIWQKIKFKFHLVFCHSCCHYEQQMRLTQKTIAFLSQNSDLKQLISPSIIKKIQSEYAKHYMISSIEDASTKNKKNIEFD
jgi:hypothetical protein